PKATSAGACFSRPRSGTSSSGTKGWAVGSKGLAFGSKGFAVGSKTGALGSRKGIKGSKDATLGSNGFALGSKDGTSGLKMGAVGWKGGEFGSSVGLSGSNGLAVGSRSAKGLALGSRLEGWSEAPGEGVCSAPAGRGDVWKGHSSQSGIKHTGVPVTSSELGTSPGLSPNCRSSGLLGMSIPSTVGACPKSRAVPPLISPGTGMSPIMGTTWSGSTGWPNPAWNCACPKSIPSNSIGF
ncbi:PREDICTED: uncharacterized protein LOC109479811, partial [Branchiostoma belcheri]|uniref:Uncharacterized protein LOC109479811 n=1 Tax=Branchiostoma belcheri TaxID=7741 RepID=A0A6P4ZTG5_BRABE